MSKSKEEIIKAVDDLQKRVEELEASGDPTSKADADKYQAALAEIAKLKDQIKEITLPEKKPEDKSDFDEDW